MEKYTIDYSKWDRIIFDNDSDGSDNDVNDDGQRAAAPQVTVFDSPTRVTFGGEPPPPSSSSPPPPPPSTLDAQVVVKTAPATPATKRGVVVDERGIPRSWTENGAAVVVVVSSDDDDDDDSSRTNQEEGTNEAATAAAETGKLTMPAAVPDPPYSYFWSQDRAMIHLRIPIPSSSSTSPSSLQKRKYHVHITNLLSYPDRHCATITTDSAQQRLVVKELLPSEDHHRHNKNSGNSDDGVVLLQGTLTHPVYVPEDYDNDEVDWSIQDYTFPPTDQNNNNSNNHRTETERGNNAAAKASNDHHTALLSFEKYILITLYKATPMMGMALWWKRCLTIETTDVTIVRRDHENTQQEAFQQAWRDAHEQFRQSMQSKEKYSLL